MGSAVHWPGESSKKKTLGYKTKKGEGEAVYDSRRPRSSCTKFQVGERKVEKSGRALVQFTKTAGKNFGVEG